MIPWALDRPFRAETRLDGRGSRPRSRGAAHAPRALVGRSSRGGPPTARGKLPADTTRDVEMPNAVRASTLAAAALIATAGSGLAEDMTLVPGPAVKWAPAPASLPKGAQLVVLTGDPG